MLSVSVLMSVVLISHIAVNDAGSFNCSKSSLCQRELELYHIEAIKSSILAQLHMTSPPDVSHLPSKQLRAEYVQMLDDELRNEEPAVKETETVFVTARDPSAGEDTSRLIAAFDVSDNLAQKELLQAQLIFKVSLPNEHVVEDVHLQIFEKNEDGELGEQVLSSVLSAAGSQKIKVKLPVETVTKWYTTAPIAGLYVSALVQGRNVAIHPQQTSDDFENMILQLTMVKGEKRHRRLATPICTLERPSEGCCLYDLMIDFEKIGWDWIVAPPRYNAYVCRGDCKLNSHHYQLNENGHTKIMKIAHRMGDDVKNQVENLGMCCHPIEYEYVKLIYVNREGRVSVANVNGMIARKCACS